MPIFDRRSLATLISRREIEKERSKEPMTRAEARRKIRHRMRKGYILLAKERMPEIEFSTEAIAEAIGLIESVGRPNLCTIYDAEGHPIATMDPITRQRTPLQ